MQLINNLAHLHIKVRAKNVLNTLVLKTIVQPIKNLLTNMKKFLQNCYFNTGSYILSKGVFLLNKIPFFRRRVSYMVKQTIVAIIFDNMLLLVSTIVFIRITNLIVSNNIISQYSEYIIISLMGLYFIPAMFILWKRMQKYNLSSKEIELD